MTVPIVLVVHLWQGEFLLQIDQRFEAGVTAIVGPSGAGKTTLLDAIAGLRRPSRGEIRVGTRLLYGSDSGVDVPPRHRRIGYVPQDVGLFPHMNVRRNILYGSRRGASISLARVLEILEIAALLDRTVDGLSGGERQRVAVARALMSGPELLLMDEPLAAVDQAMRRRIIPCLQRIRDELRVPIVYVSHDEAEVRLLADWRIALDRGVVVDSGRLLGISDFRFQISD